MLVLTRKAGEAIMIGEKIEVKVVSVRRGKVKLGFNSPTQVSIRRNELGPPPAAAASAIDAMPVEQTV